MYKNNNVCVYCVISNSVFIDYLRKLPCVTFLLQERASAGQSRAVRVIRKSEVQDVKDRPQSAIKSSEAFEDRVHENSPTVPLEKEARQDQNIAVISQSRLTNLVGNNKETTHKHLTDNGRPKSGAKYVPAHVKAPFKTDAVNSRKSSRMTKPRSGSSSSKSGHLPSLQTKRPFARDRGAPGALAVPKLGKSIPGDSCNGSTCSTLNDNTLLPSKALPIPPIKVDAQCDPTTDVAAEIQGLNISAESKQASTKGLQNLRAEDKENRDGLRNNRSEGATCEDDYACLLGHGYSLLVSLCFLYFCVAQMALFHNSKHTCMKKIRWWFQEVSKTWQCISCI